MPGGSGSGAATAITLHRRLSTVIGALASLPPYAGPPITQTSGPHHHELIVRRHGSAQPITPILTIRG
jgi:hypothetical protein